ncbi:unnamed protein product [Taenia asiatica]|uniref:SHSP domain-containing protein n=1 Tax=Taenia asiatica TaxID=60517 RepID=A0A0R3VUC4_TAEAS|nr:unnamed protein product [Taenia asiatica]
MDPIFEPIFDFSENMAGFPCLLMNFVSNSFLLVSFSKPQTYWDEMIHREPVISIFHWILSPFRMTPGYVTPAHPRRDYILDQESKSSSSYSFSSSTYSSDSNGQRCETIKSSVRQPDGVVINKEIIRKDGREVTITTTIHPDGRQESKTETSEGSKSEHTTTCTLHPHCLFTIIFCFPEAVLTDVPPAFVPPAEDIFKEDGAFKNLRRWFGL